MPLAHDHDHLTLAGLVFCLPQVAALGLVIGRLHIAAKVSAIDLYLAVSLAGHVGAQGFPNLVGHDECLLVLNVQIAAELQGAMALDGLVFIVFADRFERKHQLILGAARAAVFGLLFARQTTPLMWIIFGVRSPSPAT